jgi:signal transduction histidine kinase/CheY-like chemotaxis protein
VKGVLESLSRWRPALVGASVAAFVGLSLFVATFNERQYQAQALEGANAQARVLAETVAAALSFNDRTALRESVRALEANVEVDAVGVYDERGRLAAGYERSHLSEQFSEVLTKERAPGRIIVTIPVVERGQTLGTVYLRYRPEPPLRRASRYIGPALLVVMALLMFSVTTLDARALGRTNQSLKTQMAEREKAEAALRQSQKMEAIGRLTGGIAHDFNNMLAIVLGSLDLLSRRYGDAEPRLLRLVQQATEGAKRAAALTARLLAFSRLQPLKPSSADIGKAVVEMTELLRRTLDESIAIEAVTAGGLWRAHIDLPQLETAIVNLAINARDAMPGGGKLTIESGNAFLDRAYADQEEEVKPGQYVMVAVSDNGTGIAPEILDQVFEPFFTTKPSGLGTGLGLSQVLGFIKQSGGHVRIYSEPGLGTTVKLYLPRSMADAAATPLTLTGPEGPVRRGVTVLLVEDEEGVREFATEALRELGFDVLAAEGAAQALDVLKRHSEIRLLLTDVVMPEINGRVLADEALRRRPDLRVVFMTGYTQNAIVHHGVVDPGAHLITKPFTIAALGAELNAVLGV